MDAGLTAGVLAAAPGEIHRLVAVADLGVAGPLRRAVLMARVEPEGLVDLLLHERRAREVQGLGQRHPVRVGLDVGLPAADFEALNLGLGKDVAHAQGDLADERGKMAGLKVHGSPLPQTRNRPNNHMVTRAGEGGQAHSAKKKDPAPDGSGNRAFLNYRIRRLSRAPSPPRTPRRVSPPGEGRRSPRA